MLLKIINIGKERDAIEKLESIKNGVPSNADIKVINVHLTDLNKVIGFYTFKQADIFVREKTLWEIMQPIGTRGEHHYHGLAPEMVYNAFKHLRHSHIIKKTYNDRFLIITPAMTLTGEYIGVVIEIEISIIDKKKRNKLVSMYPKNKK